MSALTVLCLYRDGHLPAAWFQAVRRLRSRVERLGRDADVRLAPLSTGWGDADLVVVPAPLTAAAAGAGARRRVVALPGHAGLAMDDLIAEIEALAPLRPATPRPRVVRRGYHTVRTAHGGGEECA